MGERERGEEVETTIQTENQIKRYMFRVREKEKRERRGNCLEEKRRRRKEVRM